MVGLPSPNQSMGMFGLMPHQIFGSAKSWASFGTTKILVG